MADQEEAMLEEEDVSEGGEFMLDNEKEEALLADTEEAIAFTSTAGSITKSNKHMEEDFLVNDFENDAMLDDNFGEVVELEQAEYLQRENGDLSVEQGDIGGQVKGEEMYKVLKEVGESQNIGLEDTKDISFKNGEEGANDLIMNREEHMMNELLRNEDEGDILDIGILDDDLLGDQKQENATEEKDENSVTNNSEIKSNVKLEDEDSVCNSNKGTMISTSSDRRAESEFEGKRFLRFPPGNNNKRDFRGNRRRRNRFEEGEFFKSSFPRHMPVHHDLHRPMYPNHMRQPVPGIRPHFSDFSMPPPQLMGTRPPPLQAHPQFMLPPMARHPTMMSLPPPMMQQPQGQLHLPPVPLAGPSLPMPYPPSNMMQMHINPRLFRPQFVQNSSVATKFPYIAGHTEPEPMYSPQVSHDNDDEYVKFFKMISERDAAKRMRSKSRSRSPSRRGRRRSRSSSSRSRSRSRSRGRRRYSRSPRRKIPDRRRTPYNERRYRSPIRRDGHVEKQGAKEKMNQSVMEEDEETKAYRKEVEKQKAIRDKFWEDKERKRLVDLAEKRKATEGVERSTSSKVGGEIRVAVRDDGREGRRVIVTSERKDGGHVWKKGFTIGQLHKVVRVQYNNGSIVYKSVSVDKDKNNGNKCPQDNRRVVVSQKGAPSAAKNMVTVTRDNIVESIKKSATQASIPLAQRFANLKQANKVDGAQNKMVESKTVCVKNIPATAKPSDIQKLAGKCGTVKNISWISVSPAQNEAKVTFAEADEAKSFQSNYNLKYLGLSLITITFVE